MNPRCTATAAHPWLGIVACQRERGHPGNHVYDLRFEWTEEQTGPHEPSRFDPNIVWEYKP